MLICRNAERVHGQQKLVTLALSRCISVLYLPRHHFN